MQVQLPVDRFTLCLWQVDLRWTVDMEAQDTILLNLTAGSGAVLMIAVYTLPQDLRTLDLKAFSPLTYSGMSNVTLRGNYL